MAAEYDRDSRIKWIIENIPLQIRLDRVRFGIGKNDEPVNPNIGVYYDGIRSYWMDKTGTMYRTKPSDKKIEKSMKKILNGHIK